MQFLTSIAALLHVHSTMSSDTGVSMSSDTGACILDEALASIGQRIAFIIVHPSHKDQHYIASLRNEVVGIS
jgi:hypothetical protein